MSKPNSRDDSQTSRCSQKSEYVVQESEEEDASVQASQDDREGHTRAVMCVRLRTRPSSSQQKRSEELTVSSLTHVTTDTGTTA